MKTAFHTIFKSRSDGTVVGWVEEVPGTVCRGRSMDECRHLLRESLQLVLEARRAEARLYVDDHCVEETLEIDLPEHAPSQVPVHV
jgi:predicted RNase H-like HicB family nuclease